MSALVRGRVVRVDSKVCHVEAEGRVLLASLRGALFEQCHQKNPIAVGDQVELDLASGSAAIETVLPRANTLSRIASSHDRREQVLAANIDQLFVVGSLDKPRFSSNRTDRILATCVWQHLPPVLILNKIDLADPDELEAVRSTYTRIPVDVLLTCALDGRGLDQLRARMLGRVSVFYGASGAGKSSLLNALQPGLKLPIGKISRFWDQGRHTTTFSRMHHMEFGAWVIDTPGVRTFRPFGVPVQNLRDLFPDFARFQAQCRFPDCSHDHEPGCGVFDAVDRGQLAASRYASYVEMLDEVRRQPEEEEEGAPGVPSDEE